MGIPRHGEAQPVDDFELLDHWSFHIYSYCAVLEIGGTEFDIRPGTATLVPPGTRVLYRYTGTSEHVYFHFRVLPGPHSSELPIFIVLGADYAAMDSRARSAVGRSRESSYSRATLWAILCELAERGQDSSQTRALVRHPTVEMAILHIEQRLAGPFTVAQLCKEVGVSYGYLGRLFKNHLDVSLLDHIRNRRADQAEHLIVSTTLPLKVIARAVGVPDLLQFNRLMRRTKGSSPRAIRERSRDLQRNRRV